MKITKGTIVRTVMLLIVVINLILKTFGVNLISVEESTVVNIVETAIEVGAIISAWWYNNSFTERARKADEFFKQLGDTNNA